MISMKSLSHSNRGAEGFTAVAPQCSSTALWGAEKGLRGSLGRRGAREEIRNNWESGRDAGRALWAQGKGEQLRGGQS